MQPSGAIFIDGSNLYHALKAEGRLPFDYGGLFSQLSEKFELKLIYFYDATKDRIHDPQGYAKQQAFHANLRKLKWPIKLRTRKLKYAGSISPESVDSAAEKVGIIDSCKAKLMAFLQALGLIHPTREKGIDVMLVADAIEAARTKNFRSVIILSGDADFVPAVNLIKSFGVNTVNLHTYAGSSTELRNSCNEHILLAFDEAGLYLD
jgi:uncharacterized protein (TIGR00288 family)